MQLGEYVSTTDEDLVEWEEVVEAETKVWKAGPHEEGLQTMKNLSIFGPKLFFFIKTFL